MRLIDADALMQEFAEFVRDSNNSDFADVPTWNDAVSLLGSAPTIEERKKGKRIDGKVKHIKNGELRNVRECSECGASYFVYDDYNSVDEIPNYYPNCGARMTEEEA